MNASKTCTQEENPLKKKSHYRPEIDGLRALSVVGVVLFHAGLGVTGGFVGVDVFFVISGYLITGIILRELNAQRFSFTDFWVRRIKRILPAVSVTVFFTLVAGAFLLDAMAFQELGEASISQSLMLSNVYHWRGEGYFSQSADLKPLLHTWSLAVEEQFYLFFPVLLYLLHRYLKALLFPALLLLGLFSFVLSDYAVYRFPGATFYMLPTRAWELIIGSVAVYGGKAFKPHWGISEFLSFLGLGMILVSMFAYSPSTIFPGATAVLPVFGAATFILANENRVTVFGRVLSHSWVVFLGLISYSLYLVHWPLFALSRNVYSQFDSDLAFRIALVFVSLFLAICSWRFVLGDLFLAICSWRFVLGDLSSNPFGAKKFCQQVVKLSSFWPSCPRPFF